MTLPHFAVAPFDLEGQPQKREENEKNKKKDSWREVITCGARDHEFMVFWFLVSISG